MSRYRSEEDGLKARIAELEASVEAAQEERDRLLGVSNLGPKAKKRFSRMMYRLGRALGRLLSQRSRGAREGLDALRAYVVVLEGRLEALHTAALHAREANAELEARQRADNP